MNRYKEQMIRKLDESYSRNAPAWFDENGNRTEAPQWPTLGSADKAYRLWRAHADFCPNCCGISTECPEGSTLARIWARLDELAHSNLGDGVPEPEINYPSEEEMDRSNAQWDALPRYGEMLDD